MPALAHNATLSNSAADLVDLHDRAWFFAQIRAHSPQPLLPIIPWAEKFVRVFGVKGESFQADSTPWTRYPILLTDQPPIWSCEDCGWVIDIQVVIMVVSGKCPCCGSHRLKLYSIRFITLVKPVQTGGSVVGEIAVCRWIVKGFGEIQWNWDTDDFAEIRWDKRIEKILKNCKPVRDRWPTEGSDRHKAQKCLVVFPNVALLVAGVFDKNSLDSDSISFQANEEIHKWKPGQLEKAYRRGTACAFPISLNISNAGYENDQLHEAFKNGTQQHWEIKCPGCSNPHHEANSVYHIMRTRWEDKRPDLGGLRYDSEGCKRDDGTFNYNKLATTLRYQMPCGHIVHNDISERRALSATGRYSEPKNDGALPSDVSLTYEAVTCHDIDWLQLVKEKHSALRHLKNGDEAPWIKYLQERESQFYSPESRPFQGDVVISPKVVKDRDGLKKHPQFAMRVAAADWQQGFTHLGELTYYWLAIEDVLDNCNSQVVFEGIVQTDGELVAELDRHEVPRSACFVDASKNTKQIRSMCYREGLNCVMGNESKHGFFLHKEDGVRRFYSEDKPLYLELNTTRQHDPVPTKDGWKPSPLESIVLAYNKAGLLANHFFIRNHKAVVLANNPKATPDDYIERIIPGDTSEEFQQGCESWERVDIKHKATGDDVEGFHKIRRADHPLMCLAYIDMIKDWSGLLGDRLAMLGLKPVTEK